VGAVCALGDFPHSGNHPAGFHLYDADNRLSEHGLRRSLKVSGSAASAVEPAK